jgi:1,4-alpha-glucan branching enzyme
MTVISRVEPILKDDEYLHPYQATLEHRVECSDEWISTINETEGGIDKFTRGYEQFGFIITPEGIRYREWAPGVVEAYLIGDFSMLLRHSNHKDDWDRSSHKMSKNKYGVWEINLPNDASGNRAILHNTRVKISMVTASFERIERIPVRSTL